MNDHRTRASETKPDPVDPFVGRTLDGYRIDALIGRGGMGAVYRATQLSLNRSVAIKVIPVEVAEHPQFQERFEREVDILSKLSHPNVVTVHERGEVDGRPYVVMEYVAGSSLREVIKQGPLPPSEALVLVRGVLSALEHAHDKGVVHRDIKPENVLVAPGGIVKVADFGLSRLLGPADVTRLTHTHLLLGTFEYMAPEQREKAKEADERSDLYATGVVLYELLTGELPIGKFESPSEKRSECDSRIDDIVGRSLEKDPAKRWQRASEMGAAVSRLLSSAPIEPAPAAHAGAEPPAPWPPDPPVARPPRAGALAWVVVAVIAVSALAYGLLAKGGGFAIGILPILAIVLALVVALVIGLVVFAARARRRPAAVPATREAPEARVGLRGWHVVVGLLLLWLVGVIADASSSTGLDWSVLILGGAAVALVMWWLVTHTGHRAHAHHSHMATHVRRAGVNAAGVAFWIFATFGVLIVLGVLGLFFLGVRSPEPGPAAVIVPDSGARVRPAQEQHALVAQWKLGPRLGVVEEWSGSPETLRWLAAVLECDVTEAGRFRLASSADNSILMDVPGGGLDAKKVHYAYAWALSKFAPVQIYWPTRTPESTFLDRIESTTLPPLPKGKE